MDCLNYTPAIPYVLLAVSFYLFVQGVKILNSSTVTELFKYYFTLLTLGIGTGTAAAVGAAMLLGSCM